MAVHTSSSLLISFITRLGVKTVIISSLLVGVALCACDLGWSYIVRRGFDIAVAIHAIEHAVDGRLKVISINVEADLLAALLFRHGGIIVASKTLFVGRFGRSLGSGRCCR